MSEPNDKVNRFSWTWLVTMVLIAFIVVIGALDASVMEGLLQKEVNGYTKIFGPRVTQSIVNVAVERKQWLIYESGAYDSVRGLLLPSEYIQTNQVQTKKIFNTAFFSAVDQFINNAFQSFDLAILRVSAFKPWHFLNIIIIGLFGYTGYIFREIKKQNFDYSSPFWRGLSKKFLLFTPFLVMFIFVLPVAVTPLYVPFFVTIIGIAIMMLVANTIKRL